MADYHGHPGRIAVIRELERLRASNPASFRSPLTVRTVLRTAVNTIGELVDAGKPSPAEMRQALIQIAALAMRGLEDLGLEYKS